MTVFHILSQTEWDGFRRTGTYAPPSLLTEGFVHCSTGDRVNEVADAFYLGRDDLVLIEIDPERLTARIVYEPAVDREGTFPHVYGPITLDAVVAGHAFLPGPDGRFHWESPGSPTGA
jgi:uncharacterized protein (DUF952 family)